MAASLVMSLGGSLGVLGACNGQSQQGADEPERPPPFPSNFQPDAPLAEPDPPAPDKPGLAYLTRVHDSIAGPWRAFLENCRLRLPPTHPLNNSRLEARMTIVIGRDGSVQAVQLDASSGQADFDRAASDIVRDAGPFPEPPPEAVSDDDAVHLRWLFARDRRQAGVATAELQRIEWAAPRAVPKFIAAGDITTAARRLARAGQNAGQNAETYLDLGRQLAVATILEALRQEDIAIQRIGVSAAASAKLLAAAPELREIINRSVDVELRGEAIAAVGAIGDRGAGALLLEIMETAKGSGIGGSADNSAAAARALAAIGKGEIAEATIQSWLEAPDPESQWAALVVMAEFPVPESVPRLAAIVNDVKQPRPARLAACTALGSSTTPRVASQGMGVLRRMFAESDAGLRRACIDGVARSARTGTRSRLTYWSLVKLLKRERDDRVRAAAVRAAARLEPARFHEELYLLRNEKSKLVLAELASSLASVAAPIAVSRLARLGDVDDPVVRRNVAAALRQREEPAARKALARLIGDSDPEVRLSAVHALDDLEALSRLLGDDSPSVRGAAFHSIVRVRGQLATLAQLTDTIAENPPTSPNRVLWAIGWLTAN